MGEEADVDASGAGRGDASPAKAPDAVVGALDAAMRRFEIVTPARMAAFHAPARARIRAAPAGGPNLSYRSERLRQVFPKYFPSDAGGPAVRSQARAALPSPRLREPDGERAGGERRRLALSGSRTHPTHREGQLPRVRAEDRRRPRRRPSDLLATPEPGVSRGRAWFWARNGLNALADAGDFVTITRRINGGLNESASAGSSGSGRRPPSACPRLRPRRSGGRSAPAGPARPKRRRPRRRPRTAAKSAATASRSPAARRRPAGKGARRPTPTAKRSIGSVRRRRPPLRRRRRNS